MLTIVLFVLLFFACKGLKGLCLSCRKVKAAPAACADNKVTRNLAVLEALQAQRDLIEEQISDIDTQLDYCPPEKVRNQYMSKKTALLGKLAVCESKISRLCGA